MFKEVDHGWILAAGLLAIGAITRVFFVNERLQLTGFAGTPPRCPPSWHRDS